MDRKQKHLLKAIFLALFFQVGLGVRARTKEHNIPEEKTSALKFQNKHGNRLLPSILQPHHKRFTNRQNVASNATLSSPQECARSCKDGEKPKTCYYHFTLELYDVLNEACEVCTPNSTDYLSSNCQCILADGVEKGITSINRGIPGPSIQVCEGDKIVVDVENHIEGMEVSIHWHGVFQKGSQYYDGVPMVTQCSIPQADTFRYQYLAGNAGTHFYHSHAGLQKLDGIFGSLIIRQTPSEDVSFKLYDFDLPSHVVLINDWLHEYTLEKFPGRLSSNLGQDPDSVLINGKGQFLKENGCFTSTPLEVFTVTPGKKYRFRLISSFCTVCPAQITVEKHSLTVIASDGEPVKPTVVNSIIAYSGERYDFVIDANQPSGAYWIQVRALGECGIHRVQQVAILKYSGVSSSTPTTPRPTYDACLPPGIVLNPLDGLCTKPRKNAICVNQLSSAEAVDATLLKPKPDVKIYLPFKFVVYTPAQLYVPGVYEINLVAPDGALVRSFIDGISSISPPSPPLSQISDIPPEVFCNGTSRPPNCGEECTCAHKIDIPLNALVEVIMVDVTPATNLSHPFHLHGYAFRVVGLGTAAELNLTVMALDPLRDLDNRGLLARNFNLPPGKDTVSVPYNGFLIYRFIADNPGYWFYHCHFLDHIPIGMNVIFHVGKQSDLPPVPPNFPKCGNFLPPITPP